METEEQDREISPVPGHRYEFLLTLIAIFALPIFRIPSLGIPVSVDKALAAVVMVSLALLVWLIARLFSGTISFPRSGILYAFGFVWISQLLATIFSLNVGLSLSGGLFNPDNLLYSTVLFVIVFIFSVASQIPSRVALALLALFVSTLIVFLTQLLHIVTNSDYWGLFSGLGSSLVGSHHDLGILFGLSLLVSLVFVEFSAPSAFFRKIGLLVGALSAVSLVFVNFSTLWWVVGLGSLAVSYLSYRTQESGSSVTEAEDKPRRSRFAAFSIAIVLLSIICIVLGRPASAERGQGPVARLAATVTPAPIDVRPSWAGTGAIAKAGLKENPFFGVGPGLFVREWMKSKNIAVNISNFWSVDFESGVGYIPSKIVTSGLVGALAWLLFLVVVVRHGFVALRKFSLRANGNTHNLAVTFGVLYLWTMAVLYAPNAGILALTAAFTGLFIAILAERGIVNNLILSSTIYPRMKFVSTLIFVIIALGTISVIYGSISDYNALRAYDRSLQFTQNGDLDKALEYVNRAIASDNEDIYHRHAADVYSLSLVRSVSALDPKSPEAAQVFVQLYGAAVNEAQLATKLDESNYLNHLKLGSVYESVVGLGIEGAYDQSKSAYQEAALLNPTSPLIPFLMARLEVVNGNVPGAVVHLNRAVELKPNYAPAYMLASQIALEDGDLATAIKTTELGVLSDTGDFASFFQLGYLRYQNRDYEQALEALSGALALNPSYANARYFLGLTLAKLGKMSEALKELGQVLESNPDNKEVAEVMGLIRQGSVNFGRQ